LGQAFVALGTQGGCGDGVGTGVGVGVVPGGAAHIAPGGQFGMGVSGDAG